MSRRRIVVYCVAIPKTGRFAKVAHNKTLCPPENIIAVVILQEVQKILKGFQIISSGLVWSGLVWSGLVKTIAQLLFRVNSLLLMDNCAHDNSFRLICNPRYEYLCA